MEFLGKDKLAALEEEKQQRRKARAAEAQKRLAEIGKQTQQMVADHVNPNGAAQNDQEAKQQRIGALSRVLFEQAQSQDVDGRRGGRRNRGALQQAFAVQNTGRDALRTIDDAMRHINTVAQDVTGAGLSGGLENAARSVNDAVSRVSAAVQLGRGGRVEAAANNPLAELMQRDAEDAAEERKQDQASDRANERDPHALAHELGGLGEFKSDLKARALGELSLDANPSGHELSHVVQQRAGRIADLGRDIVGAPGRALDDAKSQVESFGDRAANAPRELLQAAQNAPREAIDRATAVPREALQRAANAPREIAENLRDAPAHVVSNVLQVAHHVEHDHRGLLGELRNVGENAGAVALRGPNDAIQNLVQEAPQAARTLATAGQLASSEARGAIETAREHVDPRRLADAAADALNPRAFVDGAVNAARSAGLADVPSHLDPRAIAEQTLGSVDPRALVRGAVDPMGVLDHAAGVVQKGVAGVASAATQLGDAAKSALAPNAAAPAPTAAAKHPDTKDAKDAKDSKDAKHVEAHRADPKHADPKHAEAHHAANAQQAAHGGANHPHSNNDSHAAHGAAHGGVAHPAAPHSAAAQPHPANPAGHSPPQARPATAPQQQPTNHTPASARQPSAPHIPASKNKANTEINAAGETKIALQPVASAAAAPADRKQQIVQPSFQIQGKAENPAPPPLPQAPQAPQLNAPVPSQPAPAAQVTAPTTAQRAVPPLAPAAQAAKPAANPAIANARNAAAGVKVPQGSITPLPASTASIAPAASPSAPGAAAAGPAGVKTAAAASTAPTAQPVAPASLPATPTPAAPATSSAAPAAPTVAPVKSGGGGDNVPDPSSLVQSTVSLSPDRSATTAAIASEAQTQSKVAPEAAAARASQINPLAPQMATTGKSADAPMASAHSSAQAEGSSAASQAKANEASREAQGTAQLASQMTGAQAEPSQFAAMPPPPILQQTAAGAMAPVTQAAQTAVQAAAGAVSASAVNLDPAVVARGHAAGAVSSTLPAFDAGRFAAIDQKPPLPQPTTASVDAANQVAAGTYAQANAQIQNLANIPAPVASAPSSAGAGTKTSGGYPTREAAIADVEQQVTAQSNAQGPGQMKAAAAPVQQQLTNHVTTNQQSAQTQQATAIAQAQAQAQAIAQQQPPITGAQAAANAKPQYDAHQQAATQAHQQLQSSISTAQHSAQTGVTQAKGARNQQVSTAQSGYAQEVQGQVMPQYQTAQAAANQGFQAQNQTAQTTLSSDQTTAHTQAASESAAAKAKADADIASHQSALTAQQQQAAASHQQQAAAATAQHNAQMQQQQAQMDAQVQQHQSEMHSQVSAKQSEGQQQISQHLQEGEQGYQSQIQQGTAQANAEKAKAEQEAAAKKAEADAEKKKHSGGFLGGIVGWVKDRVDDLMNAVKSVLEAAKNMVVSIMEKARQAAMAVLEKARQAALAVMNTVKGAIQGIISACASAIRSIINAVAAAIKGLIQALANALKALVAELTSMLHALVAAFQAAMNAALDMLIAAVSLVNKNLGDKLRSATQKYRDAFNDAMNGLKANIDKAGQALEHGIQSAADRAMSVVDAAQKTLDDAVTRVEQTLNSAVEAAYNLGVRAVNAAFDAAEAVVNTAFDIAEAGVKAFFDAAIAQIDLVQKGIDAVADFAAEVADKVMEACDKLAQAVVSMIPDSWKKAFVDFWNGPWRSIIIIGLATVIAVALTVATGGVAGVLLAGLIGGAITGGAYFGGEMVARESEISLSQEGKGMYIPGYGDVQIGPDGKAIPPPGLSQDKLADFEKQSQWAVSNFNLNKDENGQVTGYDRKSSTDISNAALAEGAKGFVEGAISASLAVAGGAAGSLVTKGLGLAETTVTGSLVSAGVSNVITGPIQNSLTTGFDAAFEAIKEGKSPGAAFMSGLKAGGDALKDPTQWATAFLTMGIAPAKMKFLEPFLKSSAAKQGENAVAKALIEKGGNAVASTVENTLTSVGGQFAGTYAKALSEGKTPAQALEEARKAADAAFTPEGIATTALMSAAGSISHKSQAEVGDHHAVNENEPHANPNEGEHGPSSNHGPSEDHTTTQQEATSTTPSRETTARTAQEETAAAANAGSGNNERTVVATTERTSSTETHGTPEHETITERGTQSERTSASSTERTTSADEHTVVIERNGLDEKTQVIEPTRENEGSTKEAASSAEGAAGEEPIFGWSKAEKEAKAAKEQLTADATKTVGAWDSSFDMTKITPENLRAVEAKAAVESVEALPGYQHLNENERRALSAVLGGETNVLSTGVREKLRPEFEKLKAGSPEEQAAALRGALDTSKTMDAAWIPEPMSAPVAGHTRQPPYDHPGFEFNGAKVDAEVHVVHFDDGESIKVVVPKSPDPAFHNHTIDEAIESASYLSKSARAQLEEVHLHPSRNPDDAYWATQYNTPDFRSYMTAGADGKISIYARETNIPIGDSLGRSSAVVHETGHTWSFREWGTDESKGPGWAKWKAAMDEDVVAGSKYATNSMSEDVAETIRIYTTAKGTPRFAEYEKILGKRFEILRDTYDAVPATTTAGTTKTTPINEATPTERPMIHAESDSEPPRLLPEHQERLQQIALNPETGAPREAVTAVREARTEIAKLERAKTQAETGAGTWEHATPEERAAEVKRLDDQIKTTAAVAVEQFDKVTTKPENDANTLAEIKQRTPQELAARTEAVATARDQVQKRDAQLVAEVHGNTLKIGDVEHVNQVFDHVTLGSGFAGTANEMSRPGVREGDIVIGGKNPWDGAASKLGQQAGQSELPNAKPGSGMTDTNSDPTHRYMLASEHADNVAINKADQGIRTYDGKSGGIEPGPGADWPQFAKDGGANTRMKVTGPDGKERYFYSKQTDVAVGPGPSRKLPPHVLDAETMQRMIDAKAFAFGDQGFASTSVGEGAIANIGAGASGAWGSEATGATIRDGKRANQVEWIGATETTSSPRLTDLQEQMRTALAAGDTAKVGEIRQQISDHLFTEAQGNGALPRNKVEGAAFSPEMQKGNFDANGVEGNISRTVVEKIEKITYEVDPTTGKERVKIVSLGVDGKPYVVWKDAVVLSIGQDSGGKGGPKELLKKYDGKLKPIYGEPDATGFRPIVGVQSLDGSMRVMGAAATTRDVSLMMANTPESQGGIKASEHQDNLRTQAKALHEDSKNVVMGFVLAQKHIEAANAVREREITSTSLTESLERTAQEQKTNRPAPIGSTEGPLKATPVHELPPEVREAARAKYAAEISALEGDGQISMPRGKASVEMMAGLTAATGKEVALLRLPNGERVLRLGNENSVALEPGTTVIAHSHPEGNLQFSSQDEAALLGAGQHSSVLIGSDGTVGRFRLSDEAKISPEHIGEAPSLHEPGADEKKIDLKDPDRYAKLIPEADSLHKNISEQQRLAVISEFPVKLITSAPGHQNLRSPEAMLGMSKSMTEQGTGAIFKGGDKIKLNIFTEEVNGHVRVKSIEVQDGNHRLAAGLHAEKWNSIKDIPPEYLAVEVNGFDTQGVQHPRWIPLDVAKESTIPKEQWFEVPKEWGAKGPTAQVSGGVSSQDAAIPEHFRGVTLDQVIDRSLERTGTTAEHESAPETEPKATAEKTSEGDRFGKFVKNADSLHKSINQEQRYDVVKDFPVDLINSAPGHQNLRKPEAMLGMSESMKKAGTGSIFDGKEKIQLNVFTEEVNGHVRVKSIEVQDGNHRLAAGLHAEKWKSISDIPKEYLDIEVNGFDTNGVQHPRWIPLDVAKESTIPKDQWFQVPEEWGAKGPTAQVSGGVSSQDPTIPEHFRGVPLDKVIERSLERTGERTGETPKGPAPIQALHEPPPAPEQQRRVTGEELQAALRPASGEELVAKAIRPDLSGPLANDQGKAMGAKLGPVPAGMIRLVDGTLAPSSSHGLTPEARAMLAGAEPQTGARKVVVDGGGPTGALAAIQAFHAGHDVTVVEMRDAATLPVLWSNRPGSADILASIDPVLAERVGAQSNRIKFYEHVDADGNRSAAHAQEHVADASHATGDPRAIAGEASSWQSQNKTEVTLMWDRLVELEAKEKVDAAAEGREPRIKLMRGYQVTELPAGEGNKRSVVVQKMEQRLTKIGADGKPELNAEGKPTTMPYKDGDPVPAGFKVERTADGNNVNLGTPDDMFVAEGAGSKTRALAGSQSLEVGPSAQYIAGYFHGETVKGHDAAGNVVQGGSRSIEERGKNGDIIHAVAGSGEHLDGTWALPEVDPALNLKDPASIKAYFGRDMSAKEATLTYYKQQIAKVLEVPPERIPDNAFEMGPAAFTMQSHVSSPVAGDASNVHLIGDSRGNSHFLASLGKVTGTGTHQMAIKQYFQALEWGMNPDVAHALLERRLDAGTRAWLKSGLPSLTGFKYPEIEGKPGGMPTDMPLGGLGAGGRVMTREPVTATAVDDMSPGDRSAAREKYASQIQALDKDGILAAPRGQVDREMMAGITAATGHEVALLRLENGERVLKIGDDHTVDLPQGAKIIAHTHPGGNLVFSNEDVAAFHAAGQKSSVLIGADGTAVRLRVGDPTTETQQHDGLSLHEDVPTTAQKVAEDAKKAAEANDPKEAARAAKEEEAKKTELATVLTTGGYTDEASQKATVESNPEYFAQQLLIAKGIAAPTQSQITDTAFKLGEALKNGTWKEFKAPFEKSAIAVEDNVNQRLGNTFYEKKVFTAEELKYENLKLSDYEQQKLGASYQSGVAGMVDAASFINTPSRSEGDFSHAYGGQAWDGFVQAKSYLEQIPKGEFLAKLDVDTMMKVNQLSFAEDTGIKAKVLRLVAYVGRGFEWDNGGHLRSGQQYARPEKYTKAEIENLREAGVTVNQINHDKEGGGYAQLHYPKPEEIKPTLEKLVGDLKASLAKPGADPIAAASEFQRHFVALHPFGDSNGRTSRILMNRILAEYDLSPAIFSDQNRDISLSPAEWRDEVAKGVARSKKYINENQVASKDGYVGTEGFQQQPTTHQKIILDGKPFDMGNDGLLYDSTGRPHIVQNNELVPLAQLEHYMLSRRIIQMGATEGPAKLTALTGDTRALYDNILKDPNAAKDIKVQDDTAARAADEKYKLNPDPAVAKMLTELSDLSKIDPKSMFQVNGSRGTATSSIVSKHTQLDLELWYLEKGLKDSKQTEYAQQVHEHRAQLFEVARGELLKSTDPTRVSPENPMGFRFQYEKMMYDTSPLRFKTLDEALGAMGDSKMTFWRGDYSFSRMVGMAPNNDVRQPDAKHIAEERAGKAQITNMYDDLTHLEGTAVGSQYISTTSDLSLLGQEGGFASMSNQRDVSIAKLPKLAKDLVLGWLAPHFPEGTTPEQKAAAIKEADARGGSVIPTAGGGKEIRNAFGIPGSIITVDIVDQATGQLKVTAPRKVFQLMMDKDAVLPGLQTLSAGGFVPEQELHGLERVYPWDIKEATEASKLNTEFPVVGAPAAATSAPPSSPDGAG